MERIDAKNYLREIKSKREHRARLLARRESIHMDIQISGIDYSKDRVQSSPSNSMENAAIKMLTRIEEIDEQIRDLSIEIDDRLASIEDLKDSNYRKILFSRYSEYKSFEQISVDAGYAYNYVCTMHGEALEELSKCLNKS